MSKNLETPLNALGQTLQDPAIGASCSRATDIVANLDDDTGSDCDDSLPLIKATASGRHDVVKSLLAIGADPHACDRWGQSAFNVAVESGDTTLLKLLISSGADPNYSGGDDDDVSLPLCVAAQKDNIDAIHALIEEGADMDANDHMDEEKTPLHHAAELGRVNAIYALARRGANLEAREMTGGTPIHCAVMEYHTNGIQALAQVGANIDATNNQGDTPLY